MSSKAFRTTGTILIATGLIFWAYGFVYGMFWYANTKLSILEPVRLWVSDYTQALIKPGILEEVFGLSIALFGMSFRFAAHLGKD